MLSRSKYINEVLNEDRRINHQVFDREKEQARVFNEVVSPKGERDISAEVKVDGDIDRLKTLLDNKIVIGEGITAPRISGKDSKGADLEKFNLGIGEITRIYNDIVRNAIRPDVKNQTREMVKTKLQELSSIINTLVYLVPQIMFDVVKNPPIKVGNEKTLEKMKAVIPVLGNLLNQYGIYATISKQLIRNSFKPIDNYDIQASINNFINSRPATTSIFPVGSSDIDTERQLAYLLRAYVAGLSGVRYVEQDKLFENRKRLLEADLDRPLGLDEIERIKLGFRGSPGSAVGAPTSGGPAGTAIIPTTAGAAAVGAEEAKEEEASGTPELPLINNFASVFNVSLVDLQSMNIEDIIKEMLTTMDTETTAFRAFYSNINNKLKPLPDELNRIEESVNEYNNLINESEVVSGRDKTNSKGDRDRIILGIDKIRQYKIKGRGAKDIELHDHIKSLVSNYTSFYKRVFNRYIAPIKLAEKASVSGDTEGDTEGAGMPRRGRFSYRLGKLLDYDDERNEMYDY